MRTNRFVSHLLKVCGIVVLSFGVLGNPASLSPRVQAEAGSPTQTAFAYSPGPPFADTLIGDYPGLALGDIDGDGRIDALVSDQLGKITYYHNGGSDNLGAMFYREMTASYPAGLNIDLGDPAGKAKTFPRPELVDYNGDGKLDLFVAGRNYNIAYGAVNVPVILYFERQLDGSFLQTDNPFSRIPTILGLTSRWVTITIGDLNNDGLPDAVVNYFILTGPDSGSYHISVFTNNGPTADPTLVSPNPFPETEQSSTQKGAPRLADLNGDGLLDLLVGFSDGTTAYYQNTSSGAGIEFSQKFGAENPLNSPNASPDSVGPDVGRDAVPAVGKLDSDTDLDVLIASADGKVTAFRNDGTPAQPAFTLLSDVKDPFRGLDGGLKILIDSWGGSSITFGDLNGDGLPDALAGGYLGEIHSFRGEKDGPTHSDFHFSELNGADKWFQNPGGYFRNSVPLLVDLDKNGSLDLLLAMQTVLPPDPVTRGVSTILYFRNTSFPPAAPNFVLQNGVVNGVPKDPFYTLENTPGFTFPDFPVPTIGDFDKDGKLDLLIGGKDGKIVYLRFNGNQFEQRPSAENPFKDVVIPNAAPFLGDADGDGNPDLLVGEGRRVIDADPGHTAGTIHTFHNNGSGAFSELSGFNNPLYWFSTREFATPVLADLNDDQVPDLISGSGFGSFYFYPNVGTKTSPAYRDYAYNPLANVLSPTPGQAYPYSVNLVDFDGDHIQDVFVGTPNIGSTPSRLLYYKNIGTAHIPVLRRQPEEQNPLNSAVSPNGLINVSFGDTDGNGRLEAYVGGVDSNNAAFIKYYQWFGLVLSENSETLAAQFPSIPQLRNEFGPRLQFVRRSGGTLLDAYIYLGQSNWIGVYYAPNSGTAANPHYVYASLNDWLVGTFNLFYRAYQAGTTEAGFNTTWINPNTLWAGNSAGDLYTMKSTFYDSAAKRNYFDRVDPQSDLFYQAHLPGPTVLSSADLNGDGLSDAFVAASDGTIHFIRSASRQVFMPFTRK